MGKGENGRRWEKTERLRVYVCREGNRTLDHGASCRLWVRTVVFTLSMRESPGTVEHETTSPRLHPSALSPALSSISCPETPLSLQWILWVPFPLTQTPLSGGPPQLLGVWLLTAHSCFHLSPENSQWESLCPETHERSCPPGVAHSR